MIHNDHKCKILFIIPFECDFIAFKVCFISMKICIVVTDAVMTLLVSAESVMLHYHVTCGHNIIYDMTSSTE